MPDNKVSNFEKFAVILFTATIIGLLVFASIAIALIGLIALPFFIFLKKDRLFRNKSKQPEKTIDVEFERVD